MRGPLQSLWGSDTNPKPSHNRQALEFGIKKHLKGQLDVNNFPDQWGSMMFAHFLHFMHKWHLFRICKWEHYTNRANKTSLQKPVYSETGVTVNQHPSHVLVLSPSCLSRNYVLQLLSKYCWFLLSAHYKGTRHICTQSPELWLSVIEGFWLRHQTEPLNSVPSKEK